MIIHELSEEVTSRFEKMDRVFDEVFETEGGEGTARVTESFLFDMKNNGFLESDLISTERIKDIVRWIVNAEAREDALAAEVKILQEKKKSAEYKVKALKKYLFECLRLLGINKFDAGIRTAYIRKSPERLEFDEEALVEWSPELIAAAESLGAIKREWKVSKTALKELPNYKLLPGVEVAPGEDTLAMR